MDETSAQLIAEQLGRFKDQLEARMRRLEDDLAHNRELSGEKMAALKADLELLKANQQDHETRLRNVTGLVISLRTTGGLLQAGQAALTILAASIAAWMAKR